MRDDLERSPAKPVIYEAVDLVAVRAGGAGRVLADARAAVSAVAIGPRRGGSSAHKCATLGARPFEPMCVLAFEIGKLP